MKKDFIHPTVATVKDLHEQVLRAHGGSAGIRDENLMESAVAAPQATMTGKPMIQDPIEVAASYLFYLCRNHPFVDGNKRVALATCLVFLSKNGLLPKKKIEDDALEAFVLDVAASRIDRDETTKRLKALVRLYAGRNEAELPRGKGQAGGGRVSGFSAR